MPSSRERKHTALRDYARVVGPGLAIAATGVGAGDLVAATVSGAKFGFAVAWAAIVGALLKFTLNEGLARWQLATGTTLIEGWVEHLGRWVQYLFLVYLVIWSFVVGGALISACGLAGHALVPALPVWMWGAVHSAVGAAVVLVGGYRPFESLIKVFIGVMFVSFVGCAWFVGPPAESLSRVVSEAAVPIGGVGYILGVIGGVGGSVTLLSYGYWIREKGWEGPARLRLVRLDLGLAYGLTGVFGVAVVVLAAVALHGSATTVEGSGGVLAMAEMLGQVMGPVGHWTFLVGFWGAVATSLLGVWQGVPYLFADFVGLMQGHSGERLRRAADARAPAYRWFLGWLSLPPMALLFFGRPVQLIVVYAVLGALFMPFLAATLLYMNSRRAWVGERLRNGWIAASLLVLCLVLFGYLGATRILDLFSGSGG